MKKLIVSLLAAAMLPFSAVHAAIDEAAQQGAAVVVKGNIGNEKEGVFVTLVVARQGVSPEDIQGAFDSNVYYVDQAQSDENGDYYFRIYLPEGIDAHAVYVKAGEGKYGTAEQDNIRYTSVSLICGALDGINKAYYETEGGEEKKAAMLKALSSEYLALADFAEYSDFAALADQGAVAQYLLDSVAAEKLVFGTDDEINAAMARVTTDWKTAVGLSAVLESKNQAEMKTLLNRYEKRFGLDVSRLNAIEGQDEYFFTEMKKQGPKTIAALSAAYDVSCAFSAVNHVASWGALKETVLADGKILGVDTGAGSVYDKIKDKDGFYKKLAEKVPFRSAEQFKSTFDTIAADEKPTGSTPPGGSSSPSNSRPSTVNPITPVILDKNNDAAPEPVQKHFEDLDTAAWAKESIEYLYNRGVVTGVDSKHFEPQRNITRAEFVKMAVSAFGIEPADTPGSFADVDEGAWYYDCVMTGVSAGIIAGDGDGNFNPGLAISRQDMAVILYRCMQNTGYGFTEESNAFQDGDGISAYAREAVSRLCADGIIHGYGDNTFRPLAPATRAEVAQMVYHGMMKRR